MESITVKLQGSQEFEPEFTAKASINSDGVHRDLVIEVFDASGKQCVDMVLSIDARNGAVVLRSSLDSQCESHAVELYPMRPADAAVFFEQ